MPKTAFSTLSCPDWSFHDLIQHGTRYGYDGVEIRLIERETDLLQVGDLQPHQRAQRRRELDQAGFEVCGLASSVRFDDPSPAVHSEQLQIGRAYLELAAELGAGFVRVFGDVLPEAADGLAAKSQAIARVADGLNQLGEAAGPLGVAVVIETHGDYANSHLMHALLQQVESPHAGVLWDTHHPWRFFGEPLPETYQRLAPHVRHTHWKDSIVRPDSDAANTEAAAAAAQAHQLMSGHQHADYVLFRGGEFPAVDCMQLLLDDGYDGWFSYEWEKMWHPEIEPPEIALPMFPTKIQELYNAAVRNL